MIFFYINTHNMMQIKNFYFTTVAKTLKTEFKYKNIHQIPILKKIVINSGLSYTLTKEEIQNVETQITALSGQKSIYTLAKKSISNFKLREKTKNGVKVTLRGLKMWDFFFRLVNIVLPNIRDFRGVSKKMDKHGNYNLGINDCTIFQEINVVNQKLIGIDINFVTTAKNDNEGKRLLELLGMPFRAN